MFQTYLLIPFDTVDRPGRPETILQVNLHPTFCLLTGRNCDMSLFAASHWDVCKVLFLPGLREHCYISSLTHILGCPCHPNVAIYLRCCDKQLPVQVNFANFALAWLLAL